MTRFAIRAFVLLAIGAVSPFARASNGVWQPAPAAQLDIPRGDPLVDPLVFSAGERRLFSDAQDGRLDEHPLIEAALVACGDDNPAAVERYRRQFAAVCNELRQSAAQTADVAGRIELIYRLLHQRLLRGGYDANATDLAGTLDTGIYNCASATLLFVALAEQLNLNAQAVELPGHVRAVIDCGNQCCEVEATSPVWSGAVGWMNAEPSPLAGEGRVRGTAAENPNATRREITALGLIAMIYYNRGVDAVYHSRYAEAVAANRKALLLDSNNATARGNLLAAVNNWALALASVGRFNEAETLLAAGRRFAPEHLPFEHNAAHVRRMQAQATMPAGPTASNL